ncbi:MAG: sigma-70 family RNA polymerase sigma factor [Tepidisphaeraceae bacterium]
MDRTATAVAGARQICPVLTPPRGAVAEIPIEMLLPEVQAYLLARKTQCAPGIAALGAWGTFYKQCSPLVAHYTVICHVPPAERDDCVQNVWAELVEKLPEFRYDSHRGRFRDWLFSLVHSEAVDLARRRALRAATPLTGETRRCLVSREPDPSAVAVRQSDRELARKLIEELRVCETEANFKVVDMRWLKGCTVAEVSAETGLSPEQVWSRHHRIKFRARKLLRAIAGGIWSAARLKK